MKKLVLLLMAALALPVMAQMTATKSQDMRTTDRNEMVNIVPMKAIKSKTNFFISVKFKS